MQSGRARHLQDNSVGKELVDNLRAAGLNLPAAGVHLEVWIQSKLLDSDQHAALSRGGAQLRPAIRARAPDGGNPRCYFLGRCACAQHLAEIDAGLRV